MRAIWLLQSPADSRAQERRFVVKRLTEYAACAG